MNSFRYLLIGILFICQCYIIFFYNFDVNILSVHNYITLLAITVFSGVYILIYSSFALLLSLNEIFVMNPQEHTSKKILASFVTVTLFSIGTIFFLIVAINSMLDLISGKEVYTGRCSIYISEGYGLTGSGKENFYYAELTGISKTIEVNFRKLNPLLPSGTTENELKEYKFICVKNISISYLKNLKVNLNE